MAVQIQLSPHLSSWVSRILTMARPSNGSKARYIGNQANFELLWALDLHTTINIDLAGFITGGFLKDTGQAGNVAFSNVGIDYKF